MVHRAVVGTSSLENNQLLMLRIMVPSADRFLEVAERDLYELPEPFTTKRIQVELSIPQCADVLRARCNPGKASLVASKCAGLSPELNIYDFATATS